MKHDTLHGVAHNFADSIASGQSFVVPYHVIQTDVYAEAAENENDCLVVNILTAQAHGARSGGGVEAALPLLKSAFPAFCEKHGIRHSDYADFLIRFTRSARAVGRGSSTYIITIQDRNGKRTSREYIGVPGKRSKVTDELGRPRPKQFSAPVD